MAGSQLAQLGLFVEPTTGDRRRRTDQVCCAKRYPRRETVAAVLTGSGLKAVEKIGSALGLVMSTPAVPMSPVRIIAIVCTAQVFAQIGAFAVPALLPTFIDRWDPQRHGSGLDHRRVLSQLHADRQRPRLAYRPHRSGADLSRRGAADRRWRRSATRPLRTATSLVRLRFL